ncbi:hypothetical protein [Methylobacterium haplocladii]|uniref:Uncharacterized protein n=1 Tax=Methylobacterium haplocladii TaxID=1176176 RepID=A0A512IKZ1_9HYPH|nr:hypothetical protein [Methylobacterium haplocladii]GEO98308.1 hypothetical protein MHA02_06960 [Methylobacterium haplocladii]GJD86382.1 hypothetical protein HPGCJGGD_4288 [Methylobacterium haplocladii]GLS58398.1 hypothetical protein GCM10007887_10580 [Methylobacterium haplocladii]
MTDLSMDAGNDAVLFANDDWQLLPDGLEHRATGYFIARAALSDRRGDGLWTWPLQLAEKSWCAPRLFREAFLAALQRFECGLDEALTRSFAIGFGMRPALSGRDGFVALGDVIRPKSAARKRPVETKATSRQPVRDRVGPGERVPMGASA